MSAVDTLGGRVRGPGRLAPGARQRPAQRRLDEGLPPCDRRDADRALREEHRPSGGGQPLVGTGGEGPTLGDLVASAWEGLLVAGSVACPVCRERMERRDGHGICSSCSTMLF